MREGLFATTLAVRLTVAQMERDDVYRDMARIHKSDRGSIREGTICKLSVNGRNKLVAARGLTDSMKGKIRIDELAREELNLNENESYDFRLSRVGIIGKVCWACRAADPSSRIAAWISILSLFLGIVGLVLGILSIRH